MASSGWRTDKQSEASSVASKKTTASTNPPAPANDALKLAQAGDKDIVVSLAHTGYRVSVLL